MAYSRLAMKDPRTIAVDNPGIFDSIFPQLTAGVSAYFNKSKVSYAGLEAIPIEVVQESSLKRAMLFEIACARGEQILKGHEKKGWETCLEIAIARQSRHYNALAPQEVTENDYSIADWCGRNLAEMLNSIKSNKSASQITHAPEIFGFQWITSSVGDFAIADNLIEVKCTSRNFGSADYRQVLMYWLLSYAASIAYGTPEWKTAILLNPRLNHQVELPFDEIIRVTSAGKSKVEILELFTSMVGDYALNVLPDFKL